MRTVCHLGQDLKIDVLNLTVVTLKKYVFSVNFNTLTRVPSKSL